MKIHTKPLTPQEIRDAITDGHITAVFRISLADAIDAEGLDQFNEMFYECLPGVDIGEMEYEIVGFTPPRENDRMLAKGELHVKVRAPLSTERSALL